MRPMTGSSFALAAVYHDGTITMVLRGVLTAGEERTFAGALRDALRRLPGRLVIDVTELEDLHPRAARTLGHLCDSPAGHLVPVVVRAPTANVLKVLDDHNLGGLAIDRAEDAAEELDTPLPPDVWPPTAG